jgi:hypothetical protein
VIALKDYGINLAHLQIIDGLVSDVDHSRLWAHLGRIQSELPVYSSKILTTPTVGEYRSFGNAEVYDTDKLVAAYHLGPDHYGSNGDVRVITSADAGATWSAETIINTVAVGDYQRGARIGVLDSGRWLVVYITQNSTQTAAPSFARYSDDEGVTWSDAIAFPVPESVTEYGVSVVSPPISLANGDVITSGWGYQAANNRTGVVVYRSEDEGETWAVDSTVFVTGKHVNETCMQILANGDLLMLIRGANCGIHRTTADPTADPLVWSTPTELFRGEALPGFRQVTGGRIILCTRDYASTYYTLTGNYPMCLYTSDDNGITWVGPYYPEPTHRKFMYGRPVELGGSVYLWWSETSLGSTNRWRDISEYAS